MHRALAALLLLGLVSGCLAQAPDVERAQADAPAAALATPTLALAECPGACFEPSLAVDLEGRIFVTTQAEERMAVSEDGGATWRDSPLPLPPDVPGLPAATPDGPNGIVRALHRGDILLQTDAQGRLYLSAMVGAHAFQVARSDDAGATWALNTLVAPLAGAAPATIDRQWLGFGPDGTVYLSYMQLPSGVWVARSDDGGATWGAFARVAATEERRAVGHHGAPTVSPTGRVAVPFVAGPPFYGALAQFPTMVRVALSDDGGATWRSVDAHAPPVGAPPPRANPMAAYGPDGALHVAWPRGSEGGLELVLATSPDGGETWYEPRVLADDADARMPALAAAGDDIVVSWLTHDARQALARANGAAAQILHVENVAPSHFAALALGPQGEALLAWTAREGVLVAREANR